MFPVRWVITRHRAVESLVSFSNCVIYILHLPLSSKFDDIMVACCDKQHFYFFDVLFFFDGQFGVGGVGCWRGGGEGGSCIVVA